MNLSGIPPPLKSFSFHSYEFNKIKTFTNLRLEKYYQSYSFRAFFSFDSFSLISLLFSPKRILKKKITIFSSKTSPSSFSKLSDFSCSTTNKSKRPLPNHHPYYKFPFVYPSNFDNFDSLSFSLFRNFNLQNPQKGKSNLT